MDASLRDDQVRLRAVERRDLETLFAHKCDAEARLVAMVKADDRERFMAHWAKIMGDERVIARVIELGGEVVGNVSCFQAEGMDWVGYWIDRAYWGRGIATRALALLLDEVKVRPLHARVAMSNVGSIRVLERCGFVHQRTFMGEETDRYLACEEAEYRRD
jgi:RimJ/RimL family protein N-acetyltransferase